MINFNQEDPYVSGHGLTVRPKFGLGTESLGADGGHGSSCLKKSKMQHSKNEEIGNNQVLGEFNAGWGEKRGLADDTTRIN